MNANGKQEFDALVIGAGMTGAAVATELSLSRKTVLLIDSGLVNSAPFPTHFSTDPRLRFGNSLLDRLLSAHLLPVSSASEEAAGKRPALHVPLSRGGASVLWTGVLCRMDLSGSEGDAFARAALDPFYDQAANWLGALNGDALNGDITPVAMARPHGPNGPVAGPIDIFSRAAEIPEIRPYCARRLIHSGGQVTSVETVDVSTGATRHFRASEIVIAADPLRSAALLHASGLCAEDGFPVGRYLADHPLAAARLSELSPQGRRLYDAMTEGGSKMGAACLPTAPDGVHALILAPPSVQGAATLALFWYMSAEPRAANGLRFDTTDDDVTGLWGARIDMPEAVASEEELSTMRTHLKETGDRLGTARGMGVPRLLPLGAASHAFGTLRSGAEGQSVTDLSGRVHGMRNLWVAGTARFPARNARNPMLAAVATAIGTARAIAG